MILQPLNKAIDKSLLKATVESEEAAAKNHAKLESKVETEKAATKDIPELRSELDGRVTECAGEGCA